MPKLKTNTLNMGNPNKHFYCWGTPPMEEEPENSEDNPNRHFYAWGTPPMETEAEKKAREAKQDETQTTPCNRNTAYGGLGRWYPGMEKVIARIDEERKRSAEEMRSNVEKTTS